MSGIERIGEIELAFNIHDPDYNDILTGEQTKCTIRTTLEEEPDTELSDDMPLLLDAGGWQIYGNTYLLMKRCRRIRDISWQCAGMFPAHQPSSIFPRSQWTVRF